MNMLQKRTLWRVLSRIFWLAAAAATAYFVWRIASEELVREGRAVPSYVCVLGIALLCFAVCPIHTVVHEAGHLLFGACCGMRFKSVRIGRLIFSAKGVAFSFRPETAGETRAAPRSAGKIRERLLCTTLGGAVLDLLYGVVLIVLFSLLPVSPALSFFALFAPFGCAQGAASLLPEELPAGKTDGLVLCELAGRTGETEIAVRIFEAEELARNMPLHDLPKELLFDVPAVREDSRVFRELLGWQEKYLRACKDEEAARRIGERLGALAQEYDGGMQ